MLDGGRGRRIVIGGGLDVSVIAAGEAEHQDAEGGEAAERHGGSPIMSESHHRWSGREWDAITTRRRLIGGGLGLEAFAMPAIIA